METKIITAILLLAIVYCGCKSSTPNKYFSDTVNCHSYKAYSNGHIFAQGKIAGYRMEDSIFSIVGIDRNNNYQMAEVMYSDSVIFDGKKLNK